MILLHGFGASLEPWEARVTCLSADYRVIRFDLPGFALTEARHFSFCTASLSILGFDPSHPEVRVLELWNAGPGGLAVVP